LTQYNIKLGLIVDARRELHLSAGEVHKDDLNKPEFERLDEKIMTLDGPTYMKVGLTQIGSVQISGLEVVNVKYPADSLNVYWYLPDEEGPEEARAVSLSQVGLIPRAFPRPKAEKDHLWTFKVEGRSQVSETHIYQIGFQPPFKASDLTVYLTDLSAYGFDSYVIERILYCHRAPAYTEGVLGLSELISQGQLED
jgi:hypothetical protein